MRITALDRQRGRQFRMSLDDGQTLLLDLKIVEESPYRVDSVITEQALAELVTASQKHRAQEHALYLLSLRDYCAVELQRKLREKGCGEQAVFAVERMVQLGLINDEAYARRLSRDCRIRKLYARRRTLQELSTRGVERDIAEAALDEVDAAENLTDLQQALALLVKKRYNTSITEPLRQRAMLLLQRNGYDSGVIRQAFLLLAEQTAAESGVAEFGEEYIETEE